MDAIKMQDTKAVTVPFPCYKNISGGQEWPADETSYQGLELLPPI